MNNSSKGSKTQLLPFETVGNYRVQYYDSITELHAAANMGYVGGGTYPNKEYRPSMANKLASSHKARFTWDQWNVSGLTLQGLEDDIETIDNISKEIIDVMPPGISYKRKQTWSSHGVSINANRVLRGNLTTAWRRPVRRAMVSNSGTVSIVMGSSYNSNISPETVKWASISVAALAYAIEDSGRPCEIYTSAISEGTFIDKPRNHAVVVKIKGAGESWNIQNCVLPAQQEYFRRWGFEITEITGQTISTYGHASGQYENTTEMLFEALGIPNELLIFGPNVTHGKIFDPNSSQKWVQDKLEVINNQNDN